jgi:hypothetical protein
VKRKKRKKRTEKGLEKALSKYNNEEKPIDQSSDGANLLDSDPERSKNRKLKIFQFSLLLLCFSSRTNQPLALSLVFPTLFSLFPHAFLLFFVSLLCSFLFLSFSLPFPFPD